MRTLMLAMAAAVLVGVTGCQGGDDPSGGEQSPQDRLAAAKQSFDDSKYIGFTLSTDNLPDGLEGLLKASGTGTHDPAFTGEVEVQTDLTAITAPLVALDDKVYAQLPFSGWAELDPADYGAPDPANLMDTKTGISSLFTATVDPHEGDAVRSGDTILTSIDGTLPGGAVQRVFPSSGSEDFDVTYQLTDDNEVDSVEMSGPFYEGSADVTYTIELDLDAASVDIKAPEL